MAMLVYQRVQYSAKSTGFALRVEPQKLRGLDLEPSKNGGTSATRHGVRWEKSWNMLEYCHAWILSMYSIQLLVISVLHIYICVMHRKQYVYMIYYAWWKTYPMSVVFIGGYTRRPTKDTLVMHGSTVPPTKAEYGCHMDPIHGGTPKSFKSLDSFSIETYGDLGQQNIPIQSP